jgi:hypothetical protein
MIIDVDSHGIDDDDAHYIADTALAFVTTRPSPQQPDPASEPVTEAVTSGG